MVSQGRRQGMRVMYFDAMFVIPYAIGCNWWMMAMMQMRRHLQFSEHRGSTHLTCSDTNLVSPAASSHLPKYNSPRKGFKGFFSVPYLSLRLLYCCFSVLKNHFSTSIERLAGSGSEAGFTNTEGCSVQ